MNLSFDILGKPVGQGNHRVGRYGNIYETSKGHGEWRQVVTWGAKSAMALQGWTTTNGPVALGVTFYFERPKRPQFDVPAVPPDGSKALRALEDALTDAGVWKDDSRVVDHHIHKRYCTEAFPKAGVQVTVSTDIGVPIPCDVCEQ